MRPADVRRGRLRFAACALAAFAVPYLLVVLISAHRDGEWKGSGLSEYEIDDWRENGFSDAADAIHWRNARFQPAGARIWKDEGWQRAGDAAGWRDAEFGAREARRWRDSGFLPNDARRLSETGLTPGEASARRSRH